MDLEDPRSAPIAIDTKPSFVIDSVSCNKVSSWIISKVDYAKSTYIVPQSPKIIY